jgi:hypothetical protein
MLADEIKPRAVEDVRLATFNPPLQAWTAWRDENNKPEIAGPFPVLAMALSFVGLSYKPRAITDDHRLARVDRLPPDGFRIEGVADAPDDAAEQFDYHTFFYLAQGGGSAARWTAADEVFFTQRDAEQAVANRPAPQKKKASRS